VGCQNSCFVSVGKFLQNKIPFKIRPKIILTDKFLNLPFKRELLQKILLDFGSMPVDGSLNKNI
jgi:hypothetical protein